MKGLLSHMEISNYEYIMVRYGELTTKGKNRKVFINRLYQNLKATLRQFPQLSFERTYDRIYIQLNGTPHQEVTALLPAVFGISSFSLAAKVKSDLDVIAGHVVPLVKQEVGQTFKIVARRKDKSFPHISDTINRYCATQVLQQTDLKVDVKKPDIKVLIEVNTDFTYIMIGQNPGAGGYPVGVGGKALLMLSGGIDSPVAGYLIQKRGVRLECIHYASPPYTSDEALDKVMKLARKLSLYQGHVRVHVVPFTELQMAIYQHADESYTITLMRRMMYRLAEKLAQKEGCLAIVNGESVGQVASQTLESMITINEVTNFPVLRPVVGMDKLEIIDIANKIDTYETSIIPFEDCCTIFTPKNPVIKPTIKKATMFEQRFDYETLIDKAIANVETKIVSLADESNESIF